jgi:hypothetical protein
VSTEAASSHSSRFLHGHGPIARAGAGVKVTVFGAGDAGSMLISRLLAEPNPIYPAGRDPRR